MIVYIVSIGPTIIGVFKTRAGADSRAQDARQAGQTARVSSHEVEA